MFVWFVLFDWSSFEKTFPFVGLSGITLKMSEAEVPVDGEPKGRKWTVSIAVPSSIVDNAQSPELRSYLVGQIARCLVIFNIDEIVAYDEFCIPGYVFCFPIY